jgi:hypothetical protein
MRNTSTPRTEATTIAAMVPRDKCDEPELEFGLVGTIRIPRDKIVRNPALTNATMQL